MKNFLIIFLLLLPIFLVAQKPKRITQNGENYDVAFMLKYKRKVDERVYIQKGAKYIDSLFNKTMAYESFRSFKSGDSLELIITFKEDFSTTNKSASATTAENSSNETNVLEEETNTVEGLLSGNELSNQNVYSEIPTNPNNNVVSLELEMNDTTAFYNNVQNMQKVQALTLYSETGVIPDCVGELQNLQMLVVGQHNNLKIPESIGNLKHLKSLSIGVGKANSLPISMGNLKELEEISINENEGIKKLPPNLEALSNLQVADFAYNGLTEIPTAVYKWKNLKILILVGNKLTNIPLGIGELTNLEALYLDENMLETLPADISKLKKLKILSVTSNKLTSLPSELCDLVSLETLYLNDNKITKLPNEINNLRELRVLYLQNNKIEKIPVNIAKLSKLEELYLSNNRISLLPEEMVNMESLRNLTIYGNILSRVLQFPKYVKVGGDY